MHYENRLDGETVFSGKLINVLHDRVQLENGKTALREIITHPGAVGMLILRRGKLVLVRQFRYAVGRQLLEIPAGKLEKGEQPRIAAMRELKEETGITAQALTHMGDYYASPGILGEIIHIYFACVDEIGQACPDEDEFVTVEEVPVSSFEAMLRDGKISDGKTVFAYSLAKARGLLG